MLFSYLKITVRTLWRNKAFSAINIAGLTIGMATCLLILLYVQHELSYDRFNDKADRICRVTFRGSVQGEKMNEANVMPPVAQALKADYPEVETATRLRQMGSSVQVYREKTFRDDHLGYVDANFFEVFTLPFVQGDAKTALQAPNTVVISTAIAEKYFGAEDPMGKVLDFENSGGTKYTVTGIMENMPTNAHFHFDLLASMLSLPDAQSTSWMESNYFTYLVLSEGTNYKQLEAKLPQAIDKYLGPQMQQSMGMTLAEFKSKGNSLGLLLQPLTDIHLHSNFENDLAPAGNIQYIYMFSAIALFILLIACINFMNLSTAGAAKRAREVGIRKVMGSAKQGLITQFLAESLLLTSIALCLATGLLYAVLPFFNDFIGLHLSMNPVTHSWLLPGLLTVGLLTGVLAGSYPAFVLSSFQPIAVLKGKLTMQERRFGLRSGLVVFQFFISIVLTISTLVVYKQLSYIQNKQLGYQKEQVLILPGTGPLGSKTDIFKQQLATDPRVVQVSVSGYLPAGPSYGNNFFVSPEGNTTQLLKTLRYDIDEAYIPALGMEIASGRNFSKDFGTDSSAVILNETAVKALGLDKKPLGAVVNSSNKQGGQDRYIVVGVVKDFHFKSLHEPISPLVMTFGRNSGNIIVKAKTADMAGLIASTKAHWNELTSSEPFVYSFLDERFDKIYQTEQKTGVLLSVFAAITIFVACLGLFGLAMFSTQQRVKEIGVRKVLGASVANVTALLTRDFLKLVLIAIVLATPIAYYMMEKWLADFAYRIDIQWWIFVLAGVFALLIAFLTVAGQAVKAAVADPVKSLKSE